MVLIHNRPLLLNHTELEIRFLYLYIRCTPYLILTRKCKKAFFEEKKTKKTLKDNLKFV